MFLNGQTSDQVAERMTEKKMQWSKSLELGSSRMSGSSALFGQTPDVIVLLTYKSINSNVESLTNKTKFNIFMQSNAHCLTQFSGLFVQ